MKTMIKRAGFLLLIATVLIQTSIGQSTEAYRDLFKSTIETENRGSGTVAVFVDGDKATFLKYGRLGPDAKAAAVSQLTIYEIGSVTKIFTGVLLAEAIRRGEVKADDGISKYLPKSVKSPRFGNQEISLTDLATHTSGLPRLPGNMNPAEATNPYADYTTEKLYEFLTNFELTRKPGETFEYSNLGYALLGHILALRAGLSYEALVTSRILKPLGMNDTHIIVPSKKTSREAVPLNDLNKPTSHWTFAALPGAGGLRTTAADMAIFIKANLGQAKSPLKNSFESAFTMLRQGQSPQTKVGLAWQNIMLFDTEILWHGGATGGFASYLAIAPGAKRGAFAVTNSGVPTASQILEIVAFNWINPKIKLPKPVTIVSLDQVVLEKYVGEYTFTPAISIAIRRDGTRLFARVTGQDEFEIFAEDADAFFSKVGGIRIRFKRNSADAVTSLVISQSGSDSEAPETK